jgi:hypothetical protein
MFQGSVDRFPDRIADLLVKEIAGSADYYHLTNTFF